MLQVLNVAIGVTFVFLLFSLVVSSVNELWLSFLDKRAAFLKQGLRELLQDKSDSPTLAPKGSITTDDMLQHGLIASLSRFRYTPGSGGTRGVPSYIPGKSFVLALLSLMEQRGAAGAAILDQINALPNVRLKESLLALYADAGQDLEHFKANIENWFNESMDRVGGWYKRHAQQWLLMLGLAIAIICNVDAIRIVTALATDPKLRENVAQLAIEQIANGIGGITGDASTAPASPRNGALPAGDPSRGTPPPTPPNNAGAAGAGAAGSPSSPAPAPASPTAGFRNVQTRLGELDVTGVPIGWNRATAGHLIPSLLAQAAPSAEPPAAISGPQLIGRWLGALAGWILTALAASLGAPFWFDILNRFVDLRGVGRAPEEKDPTAPKKKATDVESYLTSGDSRSKNARIGIDVFPIDT